VLVTVPPPSVVVFLSCQRSRSGGEWNPREGGGKDTSIRLNWIGSADFWPTHKPTTFPSLLLKDGIDLSTPAGRLIANVLASVAAYETEVKVERIAAGKAAKTARIEAIITSYQAARTDPPARLGGTVGRTGRMVRPLRRRCHSTRRQNRSLARSSSPRRDMALPSRMGDPGASVPRPARCGRPDGKDLALFSLTAMTSPGNPPDYLVPRNEWAYLLTGVQTVLSIFLTVLMGFVAGNRIRR
jgi:hypothetical protein